MRFQISLITLSFLLVASTAFSQPSPNSAPLQTITLKDGTSIKGHLINISGDYYTIENETMGQVKVPAAQVVNISAAASGSLTPPLQNNVAGAMPPSLNAAQMNIMQDPQTMSMVQELMQDPEIMELLKNPSIMQDALSMDPNKIQNNPDIQRLMQNPKMQEILRMTAQKMQNENSGNLPSTVPQFPNQ